SGGSPALQPRVVLKNAAIGMTVEDPRKTVAQITQMVEAMGGWVVNSNATVSVQNGHEITQATISVRIPSDQFAGILEQIKAMAVSVESENITGQDVTQQYVDLTSQ